MKPRRTGRKAASLCVLLALSVLVDAVPLFDAHPPGQQALSGPSNAFLDDGGFDDGDFGNNKNNNNNKMADSAAPWNNPRLWMDPPKERSAVRRIAGRFLGQRVLRSAIAEPQLSISQNALSQHSDDVVLRFTIKTDSEREKFMEASQVLFLDVWSITKDHIDVRIAKASVSLPHHPPILTTNQFTSSTSSSTCSPPPSKPPTQPLSPN
jgi:hypothetical protein